MSLHSAPDIPLIINVPGASSASPLLLSAERRISPAWTIGQLRTKLEPVTGIPPGAQRLRTKGLDGVWIVLEGEDRLVGDSGWSAGIRRGGEIEVSAFACSFLESVVILDVYVL